MKTSILKLLSEERALNLYPRDGNMILEEGCDAYFNVELTKEELLDLAKELQALAAMDWSAQMSTRAYFGEGLSDETVAAIQKRIEADS